MSDFVVTPDGGGAIAFTAFAGDGSDLLVAGKYWRVRPRKHTPEYGRDEYKGPQQAGKNIRRSMFDCMNIDNISVLYVATSISGVITAQETDQAAMLNIVNGCVLSLPDYGATLPSCECYEFEPVLFNDGTMVKATGFGSPATYRLKAMMRFRQLRQ